MIIMNKYAVLRLCSFAILWLVMVVCPSYVSNAQNIVYIDHEIQAGETLYSLAKANNISVDDLRAANPSLGDTYRAGEVIRIPVLEVTVPQCRQTYIVQKKETLYSISRQFGLTIEELIAANPLLADSKLKKKMELCIPYSTAQKDSIQSAVREAAMPKIVIPEQIKVAVILPYGLSQKDKTREACTMIDFYEGFLLAVQDMKEKGVTTTVYSYDEADIDNVLQRQKMKNVDIIFGAKEMANINTLTRFCETNNIILVVPLSPQDYIVNNAPHVFQVNTKMENRSNRVYEQFGQMHQNSNIIFTAIDSNDNEGDKVALMKAYLNRQGISYKSVALSDFDSIPDLLNAHMQNVIIPFSSTQKAFEKLCAKLGNMTISPERITLFGYPEWQTFAEKYKNEFTTYHCSFFTTFYNNPDDIASINFNNRFKAQFKRDQYNTYPRFGMLGYDVGTFFIKNMYEKGNTFLSTIQDTPSQSLQNPMNFKRKSTNTGFVNNALIYVHYNTNGTVSITQ